MNSAITVMLKGKKSHDISSQLISLSMEKMVNTIPTASISITAGNFAERQYPSFEKGNYQIGEILEIRVRNENSGKPEKSIFKGVVTGHEFTVKKGIPIMTIKLSDPAHKLLQACDTEIFNKQNDKQMIEKVLAEASGLSLSDQSSKLAGYTFFQYIRSQQNAWQFIKDRICANGLLCTWEYGKLNVYKSTDTASQITLDVGIDETVVDIQMEQNGTGSIKSAAVTYWNQEKNKIEKQDRKMDSDIAKALKAIASAYTCPHITNKAEATALLDGIALSQDLQQATGSIRVTGNPSYQPMQELKLSGLSASLNGTSLVTGIVHQIRPGRWTTDIKVGMKNYGEDLLEQVSFPGCRLQSLLATAMKWEKDPQNLGRVPLEVPALGKGKYWAYPAQLAAGAKQRSFMLPEAGEQVILGFLNNCLHQGVILTSVYQKTAMPAKPFSFDSKSPVGIVSNQASSLIFSSEEKETTLSTPGGHELKLSDKDGLNMASKKDMQLKGGAKVSFTASAAMQIKGSTIDLN